MDEQAAIQHISGSYDQVFAQDVEGNWFFFYGAERMLPFATLMTDDVNDQASDLNRPGVYRLNIGVSRKTFKSLFGEEGTEWDFTALDRLMPHPVYARNLWVCALNPEQTWDQLKTLLDEAYASAVEKQSRRDSRREI